MKKVVGNSNKSINKSQYLKQLNPERIEEDKLNGYKNIFDLLNSNIKNLKDQILLIDNKTISFTEAKKLGKSNIKSVETQKSIISNISFLKTPPSSPHFSSNKSIYRCSKFPEKSFTSKEVSFLFGESIISNEESSIITKEITGIYKNILKKDYAISIEKSKSKNSNRQSNFQKEMNLGNGNEIDKHSIYSNDKFDKAIKTIEYKRPNINHNAGRIKKNIKHVNSPKNSYLFNIKCNSLLNFRNSNKRPRSQQSSILTHSTHFNQALNTNLKNNPSSNTNIPISILPIVINSEVCDRNEEYDPCNTGSFYIKNISERDSLPKLSDPVSNHFDTESMISEIGYNCCGICPL